MNKLVEWASTSFLKRFVLSFVMISLIGISFTLLSFGLGGLIFFMFNYFGVYFVFFLTTAIFAVICSFDDFGWHDHTKDTDDREE